MAAFRPGLPASVVDTRLKSSLAVLQRAEQNAVFWFAEIMYRKLYRDLGYSSIHQYAVLELGFKKSRISQFVRLSEALRELPALRESVSRGDVSWTKAREVARVATPRSEERWIQEARRSTSRELESRVSSVKQRAKAARLGTAGQVDLPGLSQAESPGADAGADAGDASMRSSRREARPEESLAGSANAGNDLPAAIPVDLHLRFPPELYARFEALMEKLRKQGVQGSREELIVHCMELAVVAESSAPVSPGTAVAGAADSGHSRSTKQTDSGKPCEFPRGNSVGVGRAEVTRAVPRSPYQVIVHHCEECGKGAVETSRGARTLSPAALKAILCDGMVRRPGKRNRSALPERLRRQALERDRHRCRAAGCSSARFLAVHHMRPKETGGPHELENLITLCEGCHQAAHRAADRTLHAWRDG